MTSQNLSPPLGREVNEKLSEASLVPVVPWDFCGLLGLAGSIEPILQTEHQDSECAQEQSRATPPLLPGCLAAEPKSSF